MSQFHDDDERDLVMYSIGLMVGCGKPFEAQKFATAYGLDEDFVARLSLRFAAISMITLQRAEGIKGDN